MQLPLRLMIEMADELCIIFHGRESKGSSATPLDFAERRRLRIAGSRFTRQALHRWTWYSNREYQVQRRVKVLDSKKDRSIRGAEA